MNGKVATTATYINGEERIEFSVPPIKTQKKQLVFPLEVIYEDEYLAAIHKPAGILVSGNSFKTIARALSQNIKISTLNDATNPQPVHRLDYATTGILLVGKTSSAIRELSKLFAEKKIAKSYLAITIGNMDKSGNITSNIDNKPAESEYNLLDTVVSKRFGQLNLVELNPKTGKTHQLRRHLLSIGNPILGDKQYAFDDLILKGKGMYLHAFSLIFSHPFTGEKLYLKDRFTKRFEKIFDKSFFV